MKIFLSIISFINILCAKRLTCDILTFPCRFKEEKRRYEKEQLDKQKAAAERERAAAAAAAAAKEQYEREKMAREAAAAVAASAAAAAAVERDRQLQLRERERKDQQEAVDKHFRLSVDHYNKVHFLIDLTFFLSTFGLISIFFSILNLQLSYHLHLLCCFDFEGCIILQLWTVLSVQFLHIYLH